jgi:uncharacterized protein with FMN-binding domain
MYKEKPNNTAYKVIAGAVVVVAVVLLLVISDMLKAQQKAQSASIKSTQTIVASVTSAATPTSTSTPATSSSSSTTAPANSSGYKDGTYQATTDYYVPHGSENIKVSLTIKNGIITDSSITNSEYDNESAQYQEGFASEYKTYVVAKSVSGLNLSYVAGASDTTQGFDDALAKIRTEAQA